VVCTAHASMRGDIDAVTPPARDRFGGSRYWDRPFTAVVTWPATAGLMTAVPPNNSTDVSCGRSALSRFAVSWGDQCGSA